MYTSKTDSLRFFNLIKFNFAYIGPTSVTVEVNWQLEVSELTTEIPPQPGQEKNLYPNNLKWKQKYPQLDVTEAESQQQMSPHFEVYIVNVKDYALGQLIKIFQDGGWGVRQMKEKKRAGESKG